eukprot:gene10503-10571_t
MAIKFRTGQIDLDLRASALALFSQMVAESFTVLPVTAGHFRIAAKFVDHHALGLRAGDALHLAAAAEYGATLFTLDHHLADAGPALGNSMAGCFNAVQLLIECACLEPAAASQLLATETDANVRALLEEVSRGSSPQHQEMQELERSMRRRNNDGDWLRFISA